MYRLCFSERLAVIIAIALAAGLATTGIPAALGTIQDKSDQVVAGVALPPDMPVPAANNVMMTFEADGELTGSHVRVVLRPDTHPLTLMQARLAAQKAFLETLNEPALGDVVTRITIVVELVPDAGKGDPSKVFLYETKNGKTWSLKAAR